MRTLPFLPCWVFLFFFLLLLLLLSLLRLLVVVVRKSSGGGGDRTTVTTVRFPSADPLHPLPFQLQARYPSRRASTDRCLTHSRCDCHVTERRWGEKNAHIVARLLTPTAPFILLSLHPHVGDPGPLGSWRWVTARHFR